ncbi:MAG: FGGY family carbohydrate kinase [Paracoccaceae bacterium]
MLLPAAYLNYHLTGDYVADMSDSAGIWLDVGARTWSEALLAAGHAAARSNAAPGYGKAGSGRTAPGPESARPGGSRPEVVVAGGAGDNAAAACGIGALNEGQGFVSLGTSGVLLRGLRRLRPGAKRRSTPSATPFPGAGTRWGDALGDDSLGCEDRRNPAADLTAPLGDEP